MSEALRSPQSSSRGSGASNDARLRAALKMEIENYMALDTLSVLDTATNEPNDPLVWWKKHAPQLPWLSLLARAALAAPATSAPVERLFSHAGSIITENRARLKCDIAADLILLHDSWGKCAEILPSFAKATAEAPKRHLEETGNSDEEDGDEDGDEDKDEDEDGGDSLFDEDEDEDEGDGRDDDGVWVMRALRPSEIRPVE